MNNRHRTELDKDGNLLPKEVLLKLILNKSSQKIEPHSLNLERQQNINIRLFAGREDVEELDFDEHLQLCVSQCYRLDRATKNKFVQSHLRLEINDDNRKPFIMLFSNAYYLKLSNPSYYELLLKSIPSYPQSYFTSIDKDVVRTFRRESQNCSKLTNILKSYAIRNPRLLYCQGLNYLAAYFLINNYSQQQTFWIVVQLIQQILPIDYYVDMGAVISLSNVMTDLAQEVMPGFMRMCEELQLDTSFFLLPWLVCLYTKGFSSSLSNFVMECIVIEKQVALVKTALSLLKLAVPKFQKCEDFGCFMKQLEMGVTSISVKDFKLVYDSIYINRYFFSVLLDNYLKEYWDRAEYKQKYSLLADSKKNLLPVCDESLPVCLHYVQINRRLHGMSDVDTFRVKQPLQQTMQPSYFQKSRFSGNPVSKNKTSMFKFTLDELLIGRHKHICVENVRRKLSKYEIEMIVKEVTEKKNEPSIEEQLEEFEERELRRTNMAKLEVISSIFEVSEEFKTEEFDVLEIAQERKQSEVGRKDSNVKLPEEVKSNFVVGWFKKFF